MSTSTCVYFTRIYFCSNKSTIAFIECSLTPFYDLSGPKKCVSGFVLFFNK